jgi:hypothetical protein
MIKMSMRRRGILKSKPFYVVYDVEATKNFHSWEGKPPK